MGNEAFERMKLTPKDFLSKQTKSKSSFGPGLMELQLSAPSYDQFAKKMLASNPQGHKRHIKLDRSLEIIDSAENSPRRSQLAQNERYVSNSPVRNEVYMTGETISRRDAKYNHFASTVSISTVGNSDSNFNKIHNRRGSLKHSVEVVNARAAGHSGIEERHKSYKDTSVLRNGAI
jgi:SOS-response transcriptional repressor LexA